MSESDTPRSTPATGSAEPAQPAAQTTAELLSDRYGRAPKASRGPVFALIAFVVVGTLFLAWTTIANAQGAVEWKDVGFEVTSSEEVEVTFDVIMKPGMTATCNVEALNTGYAQVGARTVEVGPNDTQTTRYTATVVTSEEATTGLVNVCDPA